MRNGAIFPPIVLRIPGNNLIDGSTRWYAAKRIGRKTLPAILVDTRTEDVAVMLAAALNQMGGERLTASEAHKAALIMMRCGYPDPAVARELGRDLTQVRKWRNQNDVEKRAGELELFEEAKIIPRTTLGTLVGVRLEEPFKEMVKLFSAIKPTEKEAREMVSQVSQAVSETAALKVVQDIRDELAPGGPPPYIATREIPLARTAITNLLKFEGRPSAAFDPRKVADERNRWRRLLVVAGQVVKAMDAYGYEENDV
jgi:ParB-like chromosome segregation protein Spo0J